MNNRQGKPYAGTRLAKYLEKRILELRPKKTQIAIASEAGFVNPPVTPPGASGAGPPVMNIASAGQSPLRPASNPQSDPEHHDRRRPRSALEWEIHFRASPAFPPPTLRALWHRLMPGEFSGMLRDIKTGRATVIKRPSSDATIHMIRNTRLWKQYFVLVRDGYVITALPPNKRLNKHGRSKPK